MIYTKKMGLYEIMMEVADIGHDLRVLIYGGDTPHIGAIALAF